MKAWEPSVGQLTPQEREGETVVVAAAEAAQVVRKVLAVPCGEHQATKTPKLRDGEEGSNPSKGAILLAAFAIDDYALDLGNELQEPYVASDM